MLVLLLGPSGVGKTALAKILVERHSWRPIMSWITRDERPDDTFKVTISRKSYAMLAFHEMLWSDIEQGGHEYGLLRSEIRKAIDDPEKLYVVDFGLASRRQYFSDIKHLPIYIAAENDADLTRRLSAAGRPDRINNALVSVRELEEWFETHGSKEGAIREINRNGKLNDVAKKVDQAARDWMGQTN